MKVNKFLTAQWKNLRRGKGGRFRSKRFKDSCLLQLVVTDEQFYRIINGHQEISEHDERILIDLVNNIKQIHR